MSSNNCEGYFKWNEGVEVQYGISRELCCMAQSFVIDIKHWIRFSIVCKQVHGGIKIGIPSLII